MMIEKAIELNTAYLQYHQLRTKHYNREFRTIRLQLPRRSGQTTSTINAAKKYFVKIVYVNTFKAITDLPLDPGRFIKLTYQQAQNNDNLRGLDFDCMIIDNASYTEHSRLKRILNNKITEQISSLHQNFLFILIG